MPPRPCKTSQIELQAIVSLTRSAPAVGSLRQSLSAYLTTCYESTTTFRDANGTALALKINSHSYNAAGSNNGSGGELSRCRESKVSRKRRGTEALGRAGRFFTVRSVDRRGPVGKPARANRAASISAGPIFQTVARSRRRPSQTTPAFDPRRWLCILLGDLGAGGHSWHNGRNRHEQRQFRGYGDHW